MTAQSTALLEVKASLEEVLRTFTNGDETPDAALLVRQIVATNREMRLNAAKIGRARDAIGHASAAVQEAARHSSGYKWGQALGAVRASLQALEATTMEEGDAAFNAALLCKDNALSRSVKRG